MKKTITKEELKEMYENNTNAYVMQKLGITIHTLIRYLKEAGIPLKGKGNKKHGQTTRKYIIK